MRADVYVTTGKAIIHDLYQELFEFSKDQLVEEVEFSELFHGWRSVTG